MYDINEEIRYLKAEHGAIFDDNLYVSLVLGAITKRHIIISSSDPILSEMEIEYIAKRIWGVESQFLRIKDPRTITRKLLLEFFTKKCSHNHLSAMYIISGVHTLSNELQEFILEIITNRKVQVDGDLYLAGELFMAVVIIDDFRGRGKHLYRYLEDRFFFKQPHDPHYEKSEDPLEEEQSLYGEIQDRDMSNIRELLSLSDGLKSVTIVPEITRYIYDILIFVRNHRAVDTGIPTSVLNQMDVLCRAICVLFGRQFVIPSIVKLAARKLLPLKIRLIRPQDEPSLQWGSDPEIVNEFLKRITPEIIVEDALRKVAAPL